jgi:predicted enzyme related to lactoylglutathione lyase
VEVDATRRHPRIYLSDPRQSAREQPRAVTTPGKKGTHMSVTINQVAIDTTDPQGLAQWWAAQTGGQITADAGVFVFVTTPAGVGLGFQLVANPTPGKNRLHLDCAAADVAQEVERLLAAGAKLIANHESDGFAWTVMADPDGNEFCVTAAK